MELKTAKCPECGADLQIPEGKDVITCEYCGANVIVKDLLGTIAPIQNYMSLAASALQGGALKRHMIITTKFSKRIVRIPMHGLEKLLVQEG